MILKLCCVSCERSNYSEKKNRSDRGRGVVDQHFLLLGHNEIGMPAVE